MPLCNFGEVVLFLRIVLFLFRNQALDEQVLYAFTRRERSLYDIGAFSDFYFISVFHVLSSDILITRPAPSEHLPK